MAEFERTMQQHPEIQAWLENRPLNTQKVFAARLMQFCRAMKIGPEKWRHMDKFEARDLAWKYIKPTVKKRSSARAFEIFVASNRESKGVKELIAFFSLGSGLRRKVVEEYLQLLLDSGLYKKHHVGRRRHLLSTESELEDARRKRKA